MSLIPPRDPGEADRRWPVFPSPPVSQTSFPLLCDRPPVADRFCVQHSLQGKRPFADRCPGRGRVRGPVPRCQAQRQPHGGRCRQGLPRIRRRNNGTHLPAATRRVAWSKHPLVALDLYSGNFFCSLWPGLAGDWESMGNEKTRLVFVCHNSDVKRSVETHGVQSQVGRDWSKKHETRTCSCGPSRYLSLFRPAHMTTGESRLKPADSSAPASIDTIRQTPGSSGCLAPGRSSVRPSVRSRGASLSLAASVLGFPGVYSVVK